ncbi:sensor of ECF-type sigma factor [Flavobacterium magnum]|uniref:Sensor of ECF-type sigma factor n=1 Tax=Flavobacterium magnum TaxID=2162713 RepID=A0A2S0RF74_9FLAO|nr:sensor of ECF-type sigma factor [Flavobacterium magnum]AWA30413.1 sensor of ECF-type sigma factor [Flavobacterium magnum]
MKTLKILLVLILCSTASFGQASKERIKSLKVAFLTRELALTSSEAEKFWPFFNAYEDKQFEVRFKKMREIKSKMNPPAVDRLSEKEAAALLTQLEEAEQELADNRRKLIANLKTVISPIKILKLKKAEDDFNHKLLRQYKQKGGDKE